MPKLVYEPSPQHKWGTTEAGPPKWNPDKERCPRDLGLEERDALLAASVSKTDDRLDPRRWALRRTERGVEIYESKLTIVKPDGTIVVHGHPTRRMPPKILRAMRDQGLITSAEYQRLRRDLQP
ncbi:MAG: SHOCT domain-containing protein [Acidobacteriota bacterium]